MNKIFIVGIVASGKTTAAKRLSQTLNVPWYELDCIVHHQTPAGRVKRTADEQLRIISSIDENGAWIFEGTDRESYQILYELADTILFLDPPLWKRRIRIGTRFVKQKLGIEECHYTPDFGMLRRMYRWTRDFENNRSRFEAKLYRYGDKVVRISDAHALNLHIGASKPEFPKGI